MPDPNTAGEKDDSNENDDDGAPLRFLLRSTSLGNRELSINKSAENKSEKVTSLLLKRVRLRSTLSRLKNQLYSRP